MPGKRESRINTREMRFVYFNRRQIFSNASSSSFFAECINFVLLIIMTSAEEKLRARCVGNQGCVYIYFFA